MRWLRQWGPAVAWAGLMWTFSTGYFSASATSRFLLPLFHWLFPHAPHQTLETMHYLARKSAHFVEYFIFSLLVLRGLRGTNQPRAVGWPLVSIAIAAGYASLDELHQAFVPGRTASGWDVLLDSSGAIAAQLLTWLYAWAPVAKPRDACLTSAEPQTLSTTYQSREAAEGLGDRSKIEG